MGRAISLRFERSDDAVDANRHKSSEIRRDVGRVILLTEGHGAWARTNIKAAIEDVFTRWSTDWLEELELASTDPTVVERLSNELPPQAAYTLAENLPGKFVGGNSDSGCAKDCNSTHVGHTTAPRSCAPAYPPSEAYEQLRRLPTLVTDRATGRSRRACPELIRSARHWRQTIN